MHALTSRQEEILRYIALFSEKTGRPPTGPEIADFCGFSHFSTAYQHLASLEKRGFIEITRFGNRKPMGLRLTSRARQMLATEWVILGAIPAGDLTEILDEDKDTVKGIEDLVPVLKNGDYFLRVSGDSMVDVGIKPGHLVILRPSLRPTDGDIAAVWVDGEGATLKFVFFDGEQVRLQPANKKYNSRRYSLDQVRFQGVLVGKIDVQVFKR